MLGVRDTFSKISRLESWGYFSFSSFVGNVSHLKCVLRQTANNRYPETYERILQNTKSISRHTRSIPRHTTSTLQQTKSMLRHKRSISRHKESIPRHTRSIPRSSNSKHVVSLSTKHASLSPKHVSRTPIISNSISEKVSQILLEVSQTQKRYLKLQTNQSNSKEVSRTLSEVFFSRLARPMWYFN